MEIKPLFTLCTNVLQIPWEVGDYDFTSDGRPSTTNLVLLSYLGVLEPLTFIQTTSLLSFRDNNSRRLTVFSSSVEKFSVYRLLERRNVYDTTKVRKVWPAINLIGEMRPRNLFLTKTKLRCREGPDLYTQATTAPTSPLQYRNTCTLYSP